MLNGLGIVSHCLIRVVSESISLEARIFPRVEALALILDTEEGRAKKKSNTGLVQRGDHVSLHSSVYLLSATLQSVHV